MDQYLADKEAREAASAAEAAADAIPSQQLPPWLKMPATVAETRQAIDATLQDINDQKDAIDRLNKELDSAPEVQKAGIQREIDRHTTGVQNSQQEMKALQDHLKQLNRKSPNENSPDSGKLPSE
jgi:chromosome segregation ATPase